MDCLISVHVLNLHLRFINTRGHCGTTTICFRRLFFLHENLQMALQDFYFAYKIK